MPFFKIKKLDFETGGRWIIVLREKEAQAYGIRMGDKLKLKWDSRETVVTANFTHTKVAEGEVGLFKEIWRHYTYKPGEMVELTLLERPASIESIKKKLLGGELNYKEMHAVVKDIADFVLGDLEITYFVASGFARKFSNNELYYLTKSIAETGDMLRLPGQVVDKHSVGGLPGNRTTMLVIPIIASLGLKIPKTSSRAITSAAGTADTMEVLATVTFSMKKIKEIVKKTGACIAWGGGTHIAPADDRIIRVSYPLSLEPYTKMIVSVMAKKVAMGIKHLVIDLPVGPTAKIHRVADAKKIERIMKYLAKRFGIKIKVDINEALKPIGRGVGPALEARDVLRVLQRKEHLPLDLEEKALELAGELLDLVGFSKKGYGYDAAAKALRSGKAWEKMQEIIRAQGGKANIDSEEIVLSDKYLQIKAEKDGQIDSFDNKAIVAICRILGAPSCKIAGIYLNKVMGDRVRRGDTLFTMYGEGKDRLQLAEKALLQNKILTIK
ncbi:AMP phosphorylase [Candidatus Falkowbacteria bacterium]|nr:AMP phosphorylase [Candidatus Falkowbacteria bacterium]